MNDTSPEITKKVRSMLAEKRVEERAAMGWSMHQTAKRLATYAILNENPGISEVDLRKQVFLRFYGNDFSSIDKEKILDHLEKTYE